MAQRVAGATALWGEGVRAARGGASPTIRPMLYILPMTTYPHIDRYHEDLRQLIEFGGSDNEQSIRRAFESCLTAYCREHKEK